MSDQQQIPVGDERTASAPCAWCGKPYFADFEVEPPKKNQKGAITKRAITAPVCRAHWQRFTDQRFLEIQKKRAEKAAERAKTTKKKGSSGWQPPKII